MLPVVVVESLQSHSNLAVFPVFISAGCVKILDGSSRACEQIISSFKLSLAGGREIYPGKGVDDFLMLAD